MSATTTRQPRTLRKGVEGHPIEKTEAYHEFVSRSSVKSPRSLRGAILPILRSCAKCSLDELTNVHIEHGIQVMIGIGYSNSYIGRCLAGLTAFLGWSVQSGYVRGNAAMNVTAPAIDVLSLPIEVPVAVVSAMQIHTLKEGTVEQILFWAALRAGCRISEPCMARIKDIMLEPQNKKAFLVVATKTGPRRAKMPAWSYPYWVAMLQANGHDDELPLLHLGGGGISTTPAARAKDQERRTAAAATQLDLLQMACFEEIKFNPKDMRSTFAIRFLRNNPGKLAECASQMGNSPAVLLKKYAELLATADFTDVME